MYITNYPLYIPLMAASLEYEQHVKNEGISEKIILAKSDGYPMQIVQLETTVDKLNVRHGDYF